MSRPVYRHHLRWAVKTEHGYYFAVSEYKRLARQAVEETTGLKWRDLSKAGWRLVRVQLVEIEP